MFGKKSGGRVAKAMVAFVTAAATLMVGATSASAANVSGYPGYYWEAYTNGSHYNLWHGEFLGIMDYKDGHPAYCIESGVEGWDISGGTWTTATSTAAKQAAYIVDKYESNTSDTVQAAVAYAVHELLDDSSNWDYVSSNVGLDDGGDISTVKSYANSYIDDAEENMPAKINASYAYTQAERTGTVNVGIQNSDGDYVSGVDYTITISGSAVFDSTGTKTYTGTTSGKAQHIAWTATGNGDVTATVKYEQPVGYRQSTSVQDMFTIASDPETTTGAITFEVRKSFQPTVTSDVADERIETGQVPLDVIESGVEDGDEWYDDIEVLYEGELYGPYDSADDAQTESNYTSDKLVATANTTFDGEGQTWEMSEDDIQWEDGYDETSLESGYYHWVWKIIVADQDEDVQDYITDDYTDAATDEDETLQEQRNMQVELSSSVSDAYSDDTSLTVTGQDGTERAAVQIADDFTYAEPGVAVEDNVTLDVLDSNGDGTVDTYDWLHTSDGWGDDAESEDNQISLTVNGTMIGAASRDEALELAERVENGEEITDEGAYEVLATTSFDTNEAGTFLISSDTTDTDATAYWTAEDGVDLENLPSGYVTFAYRVVNDEQDIESQTGIPASDDYPLAEDCVESYWEDDEILNIRLKPGLDSETSMKSVEIGETTTDSLVVSEQADGSRWPTYTEDDVTEGESASSEPVALDFHGWLIKVSDDPDASIDETDTASEEDKANAVHEADIEDVTDFGTYSTDSFTLSEAGTYVWYWEMTPDLKGSDRLDDIAWRQTTHALVNHAMGMASEIVRVTGEESPTPSACEISTKSQGTVTMTDGSADLYDTAYVNCAAAATIEFELWQQSDGDQSGDVLITVVGPVDVTGEEVESPTVTVTESGTYYWREKAYDENDDLLDYGDARVSEETVTVEAPACEISTKSQGTVTMTDGSADLYDTAYVDCAAAATIEYELWLQSDSDDVDDDVLITVTDLVDVTGEEVQSPTVTVTDTGTYYWRERAYDENGSVLDYGDARVSEETVIVEEEKTLSQTGATLGVLAALILLIAGAGVGIRMTRRRV